MKKTAVSLLLLLVSGLPALAAAPPAKPSPRLSAQKAEAPAATAPAPATETLTYGRFGTVWLYRRTSHPAHVALFFSGDGGWNLGVVDMAQILADQNTLVVGISVPYYMKKLNASREKCLYPASDLELLSKYVQKKLGFPDYETPVLVGYSSGATLAYAALAQAPPTTFKGAISMGFCPDLPLAHPFCSGHGIASDPGPKGKGIVFRPTSTLEQPWVAFQGTIDQVCNKDDVVKYTARVKNGRTVLLPDVGHGFSRTNKWAPQFREAFQSIAGEKGAARGSSGAAAAPAPKGVPSVAGLPLVEVPAKGKGGTALAVILSGDGGWASIDKDVAGALAAKGIPVVGWNSLQYFWSRKPPEVASKDLERILRHYLAVWDKQEALLVGYSFGADVLPFFTNRLPADLLEKVRLLALLGPSKTADFEFHVTDWLGGGSKGQPVLPEIRKLAGHPPILCLYGSEEKDSLCPQISTPLGKAQVLPGAHHFGGDYDALAALILKEAQGGGVEAKR
ncbi:MAG TPA: AcvB/VirJ family lysyl-phosphatidylglycerol hydrolase [Thermoanaerobaculia bacterium]|nr:AcvB/VirJ family lysyl-phosphatidylglycerol hydrolase [Thermoanaerobaculia bacterium]